MKKLILLIATFLLIGCYPYTYYQHAYDVVVIEECTGYVHSYGCTHEWYWNQHYPNWRMESSHQYYSHERQLRDTKIRTDRKVGVRRGNRDTRINRKFDNKFDRRREITKRMERVVPQRDTKIRTDSRRGNDSHIRKSPTKRTPEKRRK